MWFRKSVVGKLVVRCDMNWKVIRSIPASGNVEDLLFFFLFLVEQTAPGLFLFYISLGP